MTDKLTTLHDLHDQALAWVARLCADDLSETDLADFADWLAESDQHQHSWDAALALWDDLEVVGHLPLEELMAQPAAPVTPVRNRWRKRWVPLATAATLLMAVMLWTTQFADPEFDSYQTSTGEYLEVALQDGSVIELNTDTELQVFMENRRRLVKLVRGEAFFAVEPDKQRPFVVDFGDVRAEVLGTAFNVYRSDENQGQVVVTEGVVKVAEEANKVARVAQSTLLLAGQSVEFSKEQGLSETVTLDPAAVTAWREQNLVFDGDSLASAVAQLNRYLEQKVVLDAAVGGGQRISGVFSLQDKAASIQAIAQATGLEAHLDDGRWRLSPANP